MTDIIDARAVGHRIGLLRARKGLTQYQAAYEIGVPPRTYQTWEAGHCQTSRVNYERIGNTLGASANWILFGQEKPPDLSPRLVSQDQIDALEERSNARHREVLEKISELRAILDKMDKSSSAE